MALLEKEAQQNLKHNLEFLMRKHNISTHKQMALDLGISEATLSKIMKEGSIPTIYPFFDRIRINYSLTIDEMLFSDLQQKDYDAMQQLDAVPEKTLARYMGLFQIYYFDTTSFKGRERGEHGKSLRSGIVFITRNPEAREIHKAYAIFDMKKEAADDLYVVLANSYEKNGFDGAIKWLNDMNEEMHVYRGNVEVTVHQVYMSFRFGTRDRAFMIFHHVEGTSSQYLGGLGCLLSTSKGRYPRPCMQYVALTRNSLPTAKEEIAHHLVTSYPVIKSYEYLDELVAFIKDLYSIDNGHNASRLSEEEKEMMVRFHIDKIINEMVEKNIGRTAVISLEDDDDFYHYIKAVTNKEIGKRNM